MKRIKLSERELSRLISRIIKEEENMDFTAMDELSNIDGVQSITECKKDGFNPSLCLSKAMEIVPFNVFVKEFFPKYQEVAGLTKTEIPTTPMDLPSMTESRRYKRSYRRY